MIFFESFWRKCRKSTSRFFYDVSIWTIVLFTLVVIFGSALIFMLLEPETFGSFISDALWFTMTTATTTGYGDISPSTKTGKIFGMFFYIYGIATLTLFITKIQLNFAKVRQNREDGVIVYKDKNHYVFVDYTSKTKETIKEIRQKEPNVEIVIIDEVIEKHPMLHDKNVFFIRGDASSEEILLQANIQHAKNVVIFSDNTIDNPTLADGKTLLIATEVEAISKRLNTSIRTCVEICRESNISKFQHANIDDYVLSNESISRLLAKSVAQVGLSSVFLQLLSDQHGDDLHSIKKRPEWKTYGDAARSLFELGATLISVGENLDVARRANQELPEDITLFIVSDNDTYNKIVNL